MRLIKLVSLLLILTANLAAYGSSSLMLHEANPSVFSTGYGYDLLPEMTPLTRTFSGVYGLKSKSEMAFFHVTLPGEVGVENLMYGRNSTIYPGVKTGFYFSYLNQGKITDLDSKARVVDSFNATTFMVGVPFIFDVRSLNFEDEIMVDSNGLTNTIPNKYGKYETLLNKVSAGLNINYFRDNLSTANANAVFADLNLSVRHPIPYLGEPADLISIQDIENERKQKKEAYLVRVMNSIQGADQNLSASQMLSLQVQSRGSGDNYIENLNRRYSNRMIELENAIETRDNIYLILNDFDVDLKESDISNYFSLATKELDGLTEGAIDLLNYNDDLFQNNIQRDLEKNKKLSEEYLEKLQSTGLSPSIFQKIQAYYSNSYAFIDEEYEPVDFDAVIERYEGDAETYRIKRGDTWESILTEYYGSADHLAQVLRFNKIDGTKLPNRNERISIPPTNFMTEMRILDTKHQERILMEQGYIEYEVNEGEDFKSISSHFFNSEDRDKDIAKFNDMKVINKMEPGQIIRIPKPEVMDAKRERVERFVDENKSKIKAIEANELTAVQELYIEGLVEKINNRIGLYQLSGQLKREKREVSQNLKNLFNEQKNEFAKIKKDSSKDLKRFKIKRELDFLNASDEVSKKESMFEYKFKERELLDDILQTIYKSKRVMIRQLVKEEERKLEYTINNIKNIHELALDAAEESYTVEKEELRGQESALNIAENQYQQEKSLIEKRMARDISDARFNSSEKMNDLDWQIYITELIYLGGGGAVNTGAFGVALNNMGTPLNYGIVKEPLPFSLTLAGNYKFLIIEEHEATAYVNYNFIKDHGNRYGLGLMYRYFERFEARTGFNILNDQIKYGVSGGMVFDLGLMTYRMDLGVDFQKYYGQTYSLGLNVIF